MKKMLKVRKKSFEAELRPSRMFVVREVKRAQHHNIASVHRLCLLSLLSHSTQDSTTTPPSELAGEKFSEAKPVFFVGCEIHRRQRQQRESRTLAVLKVHRASEWRKRAPSRMGIEKERSTRRRRRKSSHNSNKNYDNRWLWNEETRRAT